VAVGNKDHGCVAVAVAITFGGLDQLLDLGLGQVLALAVFGVGPPSGANCSLFAGRRGQTFGRWVTCRACGGPLPAREGEFVLKYFLLRKAARRHKIRAPTS
jgi:hypothetical protein